MALGLALCLWLALPGLLGAHSRPEASPPRGGTAVAEGIPNGAGTEVAGAAVAAQAEAPRGAGGRPEFVVVQPGDTLWGIAERLAPRDEDLRAWIADLQKKNGLDGGLIRVGQRLALPGGGT